MFKVMRKHDIRYFFYVGGNDSSDTRANRQPAGGGSGLRISRDSYSKDDRQRPPPQRPLSGIWFGCAIRNPGIHWTESRQSRALRRVDRSGHGAPRRDSSLRRPALRENTSTKDRISSTCPSGPFQRNDFSPMSIASIAEYGLCTVAVSEGIQDDKGSPIAVTLLGTAERDAHGNVQLSGSGSRR